VRFYRLRNRLKEKTAGLGQSVGLALAEAVLLAAEAEFAKLSEDYPQWVLEQLERLQQQHRAAVAEPARSALAFQAINEIAHDMRGQGSTFGYPLISTVGDSLYRFSQARAAYDDNQVEIVKAHVDAMRAVIQGRVKGDGGEIGRALIASMQRAIAKYAGAVGPVP